MAGRTFDQLIDFTRTTAGTYVDSTGKIVNTPASRNLLTFTQQFDNAAWTKTNARVIPNQNPAAASLGGELLTNGDFAGGSTGWTFPAGWALVGGAAEATATSASLFGTASTVAGRLYRVDFDVVSYTSGTLSITVNRNYTSDVALTGAAMSPGRKTVYVVAGTDTSRPVEFYGGAVTATIDNISVREVIGGWNVAPDGTSTADTLIETTANAGHAVSSGATLTTVAYAFSVYLRKGSGATAPDWVQLYTGGNSAQYANFNLTTGAVGNVAAGSTATITSVGNGWYRCALFFTPASGGSVTTAVGFINNTNGTTRAPTYAGAETADVRVWGAQLEVGSTATDYTRNAGGLFPPRFDYDPVTLAPRGLLIEEQRVNFYTYSSDFTNAAWTKNLLNLTAGADIGPDGTTSATLIAANAGGNANIYGNYTGTGVQYTGSIWIKAGTSSTANINLFQNGIGVVPMTMTIISGPGTIGAVSSSNGPITGLSSTQWTRVAVTSTGALTGNVNFYVKPNSGSVSNLGDSVYIWGAQLEAGSFATSYIPTVASQVTRAADVAAITGPNFTPWYNQSAGTFVVDYGAMNGAGQRIATVSDGSVTNQIWLRASTAGGNSFEVYTAGGFVAQINPPSANAGPAKIAGAYATNDFAVSVNGSAVGTDTSGALATYNRMNIGSNFDGTVAFLNGHIRSIRYYPSRLTNAQLQALTA